MANFGPKPWSNLFRRMSIFPLFQPLILIAYKVVFSFKNIKKPHFPDLYFLNRKVEKWPTLDQNHGLTPLKKGQFVHFSTGAFHGNLSLRTRRFGNKQSIVYKLLKEELHLLYFV